MRHRVFSLAAAVSLLLCIATIVVWVRSFASETILVESRRGQCLIIGVDGRPKDVREIREARTLDEFLDELTVPPANFMGINGVPVPPPREHGGLGFLLVRGHWIGGPGLPATDNFWILGVPYWFLALLTAAIPARWVWLRARARRRRRSNCCPACGYDLRASTERCPECGTMIMPNGSEARIVAAPRSES
jgi:hypothetical protein